MFPRDARAAGSSAIACRAEELLLLAKELLLLAKELLLLAKELTLGIPLIPLAAFRGASCGSPSFRPGGPPYWSSIIDQAWLWRAPAKVSSDTITN